MRGQVVWTRGPRLVLLFERSRTPPLASCPQRDSQLPPRHALFISELGGGRASSTFNVESEVEGSSEQWWIQGRGLS